LIRDGSNESKSSAIVARQPLERTQTVQLKPTERNHMLSWSLAFLIFALIAAVLGFAGIAGTAASIGKVLFVLFLVLFLVSLIAGRWRGA
jgi:uncharacterized membrane protein YtjA (UPF0391 family)